MTGPGGHLDNNTGFFLSKKYDSVGLVCCYTLIPFENESPYVLLKVLRKKVENKDSLAVNCKYVPFQVLQFLKIASNFYRFFLLKNHP